MIKFYKIKKDNLIKFAVFTARNNDTLRIIDKMVMNKYWKVLLKIN